MSRGSINRLALGTAQFGMAYGLAAGHQQVDAHEVKDILRHARLAGLDVIDTAASYGLSEQTLGQTSLMSSFKMISKTLPIRQAQITSDHLGAVQRAFERSLEQLGCQSLHALLVHDAKDLLAPGGDRIWAWMQAIKAEGLVERIGVSVYDTATVHDLVDRFVPDLIQIPYSVLDQRIDEEDLFGFCTEHSVAVHVRSIFLQGIVLMDPRQLPHHLKRLEPFLVQLSECAVEHAVPLNVLALAFVARRPEIEHIVIGVHGKAQLAELVSAWQQLGVLDQDPVDWRRFACPEAALVDPRQWT